MDNNENIIKERPLSEKLENFWYHYKWHTIAIFFAVLVVVICSLQMCGKATYDVYVLYAGEMPIENTKADSNYHTMLSALKLVCEDYDEDGATSPLLKNLLVPTGKEYDALAERGYDRLIASDMAEFEQLMVYSSEYYLCFLSEDTFLEYDKQTSSGAYPFVSLTDLVPEGSDARFASDRGIYLSSLDFGKLSGINELPEDTVVCLRAKLKLPGAASRDTAYDSAKATLTKILAYEIKE